MVTKDGKETYFKWHWITKQGELTLLRHSPKASLLQIHLVCHGHSAACSNMTMQKLATC